MIETMSQIQVQVAAKGRHLVCTDDINNRANQMSFDTFIRLRLASDIYNAQYRLRKTDDPATIEHCRKQVTRAQRILDELDHPTDVLIALEIESYREFYQKLHYK